MKQVFIAFLLLFSVSTLVVMPGCKADPEKTEQGIQETIQTAHELGFKEDSAIVNNPALTYQAAKDWLANRPGANSTPSDWVAWVKWGGGILVAFLLGAWYWIKKNK